MALPAFVVAILVCPKTKRPLVYFPRGESDADEGDAFLLEPLAGIRYRVVDGVPNLLVEDGEVVGDEVRLRLIAQARERGLTG